jgi:hypothetical protein
MEEQDLQETEKPLFVRANRGERLRKSIAARLRRRATKITKSIRVFKLEKEAKQRVRAKRRLLKQKQKKFRNRRRIA